MFCYKWHPNPKLDRIINCYFSSGLFYYHLDCVKSIFMALKYGVHAPTSICLIVWNVDPLFTKLWDFASGRQLEMPMEVMCTATCLTRTSEHVIVARTTPTGPSILVWNLPANQTEHEIPYLPMNQLVKDLVTYLNISMDDRLVVAGFQNPTDDQACYMVFDLAANYRVSLLGARGHKCFPNSRMSWLLIVHRFLWLFCLLFRRYD